MLCPICCSQLTSPLLRLAREGHAGVVTLRELIGLYEQPSLDPGGLDGIGRVLLALEVPAVLLLTADPRLGLPLIVALRGLRASGVSTIEVYPRSVFLPLPVGALCQAVLGMYVPWLYG